MDRPGGYEIADDAEAGEWRVCCWLAHLFRWEYRGLPIAIEAQRRECGG